jgi:hypothetical protein
MAYECPACSRENPRRVRRSRNSNGNQYQFVLSQLGIGGGNAMLIGDGSDLVLGINDYRQIVARPLI